MILKIYFEDFDYWVEDWQIAEAVADTFRRSKSIEGLKAVRDDNSLEMFILEQIKQGNIDEDYIKSNWWDEIKEYWYEDFRKEKFYDAFDDIIKWNEASTGVPKKDLSPAETVRLRKLANMVNDGSIAMQEIRLKSLIEKENIK